MPAKIMPGRKAGEDHARSQCPLRGEDLQCQSADAGQLRLRKGQSLQAVARKTIRTPNPFFDFIPISPANKDNRERQYREVRYAHVRREGEETSLLT